MNMTIAVALVIACAAILVLGKVIVRTLGRAALAEVGKRALTRVPQQVKLQKTEWPQWTNQAAVEQQAAPLRKKALPTWACTRSAPCRES